MTIAASITPATPTGLSRLGRWSIRFAVAAFAIAAVGLTLARYDVIPKLAGFGALLGGGLAALLGLLAGFAALIAGRKRAMAGRGQVLLALAFSLAFVGFIATRPLSAGNAPTIHDVTTDLADPPQFETLAVRADNLVGVDTVDNWKRIHAAAYGDLMPVTIARPVPVVAAAALQLAQAEGWQVVKSDLARGHIEATASVSYIRFHDDVVIHITPAAGGQASRVDMRSISRVGVGDLGVNATPDPDPSLRLLLRLEAKAYHRISGGTTILPTSADTKTVALCHSPMWMMSL